MPRIKVIDDEQLRERLRDNGKCPILAGEEMVLHIWVPSGTQRRRAPRAFRNSRHFSHLFGMDAEQLVDIAKQAGVRRPFVHRAGELMQHVDLCGSPLNRVMQAQPGAQAGGDPNGS